VRSYLRNRAGLPPVITGAAVLNQGHRALYERELLLIDHILPKDAGIRDGLQLVDGADANRHLAVSASASAPVPPTGSAETQPGSPDAAAAPAATAPDAAAVPAATAPDAAAAPAATAPPLSFPVVDTLAETGTGVAIPTPPHAMRLAPLPVDVPVLPGSQAAREAERAAQEEYDDEEEDEIRPVSNEYAAQWAAYRATRR